MSLEPTSVPRHPDPDQRLDAFSAEQPDEHERVLETRRAPRRITAGHRDEPNNPIGWEDRVCRADGWPARQEPRHGQEPQSRIDEEEEPPCVQQETSFTPCEPEQFLDPLKRRSQVIRAPAVA